MRGCIVFPEDIFCREYVVQPDLEFGHVDRFLYQGISSGLKRFDLGVFVQFEIHHEDGYMLRPRSPFDHAA